MTSKFSRILYLALPAMSLMLPACTDSKSKDDKKKLQRELADEERKSAEIIKEKARVQAEKDQLELNKAEAEATIEANNKQIEALKQQSEDSAKELAALKKANETLAKSVEQQKKDIKKLEEQIAGLEKTLKERDDQIVELNRQIQVSKTQEENLNKQIAQLKKDLAAVSNNAGDPEVIKTLKETIEKLTADLSAAQLRTLELTNALKDYDLSLPAIQVFLANAGTDSLFVVEPGDIGKTYLVADGTVCTFIFNVDRNVERLQGPARDQLPNLSDRTMIPLKTGYQKVAVCQTGDKVEAHIEQGSVYQSQPNSNSGSTQLVTARETSTCDALPAATIESNAFAAKYQLFFPYRGHIDGIETIDFNRATKGSIEFNMASSSTEFRGDSCSSIVNDGIASDLSILACRLALGQETSVPVTKGCFSETAEADKTKLSFTVQN